MTKLKALLAAAWLYLVTRGIKAALRSAVTTFVTTFVGLIPLATVISGGHIDLTWVGSAAVAAGLAAIRTLIAWVDGGNTSFGAGYLAQNQMAA